jgi:predicted dehydrogenase
MMTHPSLSMLFAFQNEVPVFQPFISYLEALPHLKIDFCAEIPSDLSPYAVIVTGETGASTWDHDAIGRFVRKGGGWLGLVHLAEKPLPAIVGAQPTRLGPVTELRVMFRNHDNPLARRLPDAVFLGGSYQPFEITEEDTETVLYADWRYSHSPMLVKRSVGEGLLACTTLQDYHNPVFQQILYRIIRELSGQPSEEKGLGVGLLGYSPFVGQDHGLGITATDGLNFTALCDVSQERLAQARQDFPGVKTYDSAESMANDPEVDLVIICTPPNTHARISLEMMGAGKHVLCEKPLALNLKDATEMAHMADSQGVHLSCHQNRRWDPDYLAIKEAISEGLIGEPFYMETFVGGFSHPCGYWHSHDTISGGTTYDWGGHYLDWMVSLMTDPVEAVIGTRHKRVWQDVTNADQERIQIRFAGGKEAEFMHSDIAATRKPKWYLLGTKGAIVGRWRDITEYVIDPVFYFHEHRIPPTEMVPQLDLYRRHSSGQIVTQKLAIPERRHHSLYRNLADHLLLGEPITAPMEQSVLVVAILEAAARSAEKGGSVEALNG